MKDLWELLGIVIADGSMQPKVMSLMSNAGLTVDLANDRRKEGIILETGWKIDARRPFDIPRSLHNGHYDIAIVGEDWIANWNYPFTILYKLRIGRAGNKPVRIVLAVPKESGILLPSDLPQCAEVATEYVELTKRYFEGINRPDIKVVFSPGNTEDKTRFGSDAIVELVESGASLVANDLTAIHEIMESCTVIAANPDSLADPDKKPQIMHFVNLMKGADQAKKYVVLTANVQKENLPEAARILGGLKGPTFTPIYANVNWFALQSVIPTEKEKDIIFDLLQIGVTDIIVNRNIPLIMF